MQQNSKSPTTRLDLALIMPVYNEEGCIASVLEAWAGMLDTLAIRYRIVVLNDGSKDRTADHLKQFEGRDGFEIVNKPNAGHGPTILLGYRKAAACADWVFQCDSDDELSPDDFPAFWRARDAYDALFGIRTGRESNSGRKLISSVSRTTVRLLFGSGVSDVNVPFRLIRADLLAAFLPQIPDDTFAPNVIISGAIARAGKRIANLPIRYQNRRTGTVSIVKWKLWKSAMRAFFQTVGCRPRIGA